MTTATPTYDSIVARARDHAPLVHVERDGARAVVTLDDPRSLNPLSAELTVQLGRVGAEVRPPHSALLASYGNIDRLSETIGDRAAQLAALEQARGHYDQRKLLTGVGLLTTMLIATAAALWAVLK